MALTLQTQRWMLRLVTLLAGAGSVAFAWVAYEALAREAPTVDLVDKLSDPPAETQTASERSVVDPRSTAWKRQLRQPLYDPPPPPPKTVRKELPPLRSKLLGTILEPGASRAMISVPGGAVEFRGVGDPLGAHDPDAVIETIGPDSIRVTRGEESTELTIDPGY